MQRTNIVLDETLVAAAKKATGLSTTKDVVHEGLRELVQRARRRKVLELRGKVAWRGDLEDWRD
jgi:Arc/MetJ family transcription regulator